MINFDQVTTTNKLFEYIRSDIKDNGNITIIGLAKLVDVDPTDIIRDGDFSSQKLAKKLTQHGFEYGDMIQNGFPPKAVVLVLEHFGFKFKTGITQSRLLLMTFGSIELMEALEKLPVVK